MSFHQLPSSSPAAGGGLGRVMSVVLGLLVWAMLAMLGLVFAASLAIWLVVMVVVSLISSLFTGRPAAVTELRRRSRELTRQRWPHTRFQIVSRSLRFHADPCGFHAGHFIHLFSQHCP